MAANFKPAVSPTAKKPRLLALFVTGHKGFETALLHELRAILAAHEARLKKVYGGVEVAAGIDAVYAICLHSRLANRVFCELSSARAASESDLYDAVYGVEWERHLQACNSIAVSATVSRSNLDHGHYVAQKTKDAIVDRMRAIDGSRPGVQKSRPDLQIYVHLHRNRASIGLDLSGESLHRRGYRTRHSGAPLKEHLAASLLLQCSWRPGRMRLLDPMCGSGTFAIEAAMLASERAPGLTRDYFGFVRWLWHDPELWSCAVETAKARVAVAPDVEIFANDIDAAALEIARENAERAGVAQLIRFSQKPLDKLELPPAQGETLVICNPPYGRRLAAEAGLDRLYRGLGEAVERFAPARLGIISANPELLHQLRLRRVSRKNVRNGPLDCLFAIFESVATAPEPGPRPEPESPASGDDETLLPLRNRLEKNARHLQRWAQRNEVSCYRLYDADLPEFAFALDRYQSAVSPDLLWYHLQEYQAPASVPQRLAARRIQQGARVVRELFGVSEQHLFCKVRSRQRGAAQYRKQDSRNEFFQVREGAALLLVNLSDYLDTGLFLDHRITRARMREAAAGKSLLNLFCYTGAASVQAALGGAAAVLNVDLSAKYLDWARENHRLNGFEDETRYRYLRADVLELLEKPARFGLNPGYDLIFFDPPSFSNSKKMQQTLDIQRDHGELIRKAMRLLDAGGLLIFSTNRHGFRLDAALASEFDVADIARATLPEDFRRNPKIHRCWEFRRRARVDS